ncbi:hypothetical protein lpbnt_01163 [Legionella pneumophila]|uniref:hypothetical protein n=1 Tax=Legionella pneumophila TaxID=446 RepID=UPI0005C42DD4|nr:hypothetical protein [Legionella pneumophila]GAN17062.1 hypothetical protein lpbnt_01163 [Legionella pneumophila]GAN20168.1 hypothetical protein lpofk_01164 [Legionella pneumophila]
MSKLNKTRVYEVYDEIINWFDDARTKNLMESEYLNLIVNAIPRAIVKCCVWDKLFIKRRPVLIAH